MSWNDTALANCPTDQMYNSDTNLLWGLKKSAYEPPGPVLYIGDNRQLGLG